MKRRSELLHDVMEEDNAFREAMLETTLRAARQRKRLRHVYRATAAVSIAVVLLSIMRFHRPGMEDQWITHTGDTAQINLIHTEPFTGIVTTKTGNVALVTRDEQSVRLLNDAELLACLEGHPAVLVHHDMAYAELIFSNPSDWKGFPILSQTAVRTLPQ
jgi:hypothetical protein